GGHVTGVQTCALPIYLARYGDDGDAAPLEGVTDRDLEEARKLFGNADELRVDAALAKQFLRMRLLEVASADLLARDVCGDREHRDRKSVVEGTGVGVR